MTTTRVLQQKRRSLCNTRGVSITWMNERMKKSINIFYMQYSQIGNIKITILVETPAITYINTCKRSQPPTRRRGSWTKTTGRRISFRWRHSVAICIWSRASPPHRTLQICGKCIWSSWEIWISSGPLGPLGHSPEIGSRRYRTSETHRRKSGSSWTFDLSLSEKKNVFNFKISRKVFNFSSCNETAI